MYTNKINSNNNFNKVQFKQNNDIKNKYFYVDQSAIDNFKLPLGMGLIYSQFEFNKPDKETKAIFKQKFDDFKTKNFGKKFKSVLMPIASAIGLALACETWGFRKQFKIEKKNDENEEKILKKGLTKKGIFETIIVSSVVGIISKYILKDMKNREKAFDKNMAAVGITMAIWGTLSLISGVNTFRNYKTEKNI
ncbi:MAG: hypothetical protein MRZ90_01600 [Candidatus Gastranaerophilales bacterium]|nr:hypothetical protein [Candidatus Gastranaerophilales bacterium]